MLAPQHNFHRLMIYIIKRLILFTELGVFCVKWIYKQSDLHSHFKGIL
ncbi:hypothetical protein LSAJ18_210137 [Latilactobacillus sakei]|nr:hypothetical protein LSAJ18_210137 [Latilactobacillus sakei]